METSQKGETVCVIGAGGYIASWIVNLLLEKGYKVRGTVRDLDDQKYNHLRVIEGSKEHLMLCKADLLDYDSLYEAINGCDGVFHTAFPISNSNPEELVELAAKGTENVITAAAAAKVRRVVFTSSFGAVHMDPNRNDDAVIDESYWSDLEYCKNSKNWYCYGKTIAENVAWREATAKGVDLVSVILPVVLGPYLHSHLNASNHTVVLRYLNGTVKTYPNAVQAYMYVKDAALVHIKLYQTSSACGRYICAESVLHRRDFIAILAKKFPGYPVPTKFVDDNKARGKPFKLSTKRMRELGIELTPVEQALYETVKCMQEKGHLPPPGQFGQKASRNVIKSQM